MKQPINVVLIVDEHGIEGAVIAIKSVLFKSNPAAIYVVDLGMPYSDAEKIRKLSPKVKLVDTPNEIRAWITNFSLHGFAHVSRAAYAKLQLHRLLPDIDKVIYLDTDILVLCDLGELFAVNLGKNLVGATWTAYQVQAGQVRLSLEGRYFNSGVMLCQLDRWREESVEVEFLDWYQRNHSIMKFNDQEILNGVFDKRNFEIGKRWNVSHLEIFCGDNQIGVALNDIAILHFNGPHKHWHVDYEMKMIADDQVFSGFKGFLANLAGT